MREPTDHASPSAERCGSADLAPWLLPAPESLRAAWLQRVLTCHQADVALGEIPAAPEDPFSDHAAWLSISAHPQGGTLIVRVAPTDEAQVSAVLEHAMRWARRPAAMR